MGGAKEIRALIRALEDQGFEVRRGGNNHWQVRRDGRLITTLPATPSDKRGLLNAIGVLRRQAGFVWDRR